MTLEGVSLRASPLTREALAAGGAAAALSALLIWTVPPGADFAAHVYQRAVFLQHGFALWNNFWYAGRYSFVTYSLLYYPLAALLGIKLLAVATIAAAALAFAVVVMRQWGPEARWSSRTFAVVWAGIVLTASFPFALGTALALLALWALQGGRLWRFFLFGALTLAASPLAFLLLALVLLGIAVGRRTPRRTLVGVGLAIGVLGLVEVALWRVFPDEGRYPFSIWELLGAYVFCGFGIVLSWRVEGLRLLRTVFPVYAVACTLAYIIPSALGDNVLRVRYVAFPIAVLLVTMRKWQPRTLAFAALVLALAWNVTPLANSFAATSGDPSTSAAYWAPAIRYLHRHLTPSYRVEAVDTAGHWAADYLPLAGIPLVRGWFRQQDFPQNALLYGKFGPSAYMHWLRSMGVRYVVLTNAPPDYSAEAEMDLLKSGRLPLPIVYADPHLTVFEVQPPRAIVTGPAPAHMVALLESSMAAWVAAPGRYRIAVRYSQYWKATSGCLSKGGDGMIRLLATRRGLVEMTFDVTPGRVLSEMAGSQPKACG